MNSSYLELWNNTRLERREEEDCLHSPHLYGSTSDTWSQVWWKDWDMPSVWTGNWSRRCFSVTQLLPDHKGLLHLNHFSLLSQESTCEGQSYGLSRIHSSLVCWRCFTTITAATCISYLYSVPHKRRVVSLYSYLVLTLSIADSLARACIFWYCASVVPWLASVLMVPMSLRSLGI